MYFLYLFFNPYRHIRYLVASDRSSISLNNVARDLWESSLLTDKREASMVGVIANKFYKSW